MDFKRAICSAAALASKDEKIAILQARHDVPTGAVYRGGSHWAHFEIPGHEFPSSFVLDAKQAAQAARKAKATTWDLVCSNGIPVKFVFKGEGPEQVVSATPCTHPETWFPQWPAPGNELKDVVHRGYMAEEWNSLLATIQKAQEDKIRPGHRCVRFAPWGAEAGDEVHYARAKLWPEVDYWGACPLVEATSLRKLPKVKPGPDLFCQCSIGFSETMAYVQALTERRIIHQAAAWFPPLEKLLPAELDGCPEIQIPTKTFLQFLRTIKKKAERRTIRFWTYPEGPAFGLDPLDIETIPATFFPCDVPPVPLNVHVDGNRMLDALRVWPSDTVEVRWIPDMGSRTLLRLEAPGYVEHIFPLVELQEVQPWSKS